MDRTLCLSIYHVCMCDLQGVVRKRLLPFLLFDKINSSETPLKAPDLTSILGGSEVSLPIFPALSREDQIRLLQYLQSCAEASPEASSHADADTVGDHSSAWSGDDDVNQWNKLRIFQSSVLTEASDDKASEKAIGKILSVDHKCKCKCQVVSCLCFCLRIVKCGLCVHL